MKRPDALLPHGSDEMGTKYCPPAIVPVCYPSPPQGFTIEGFLPREESVADFDFIALTLVGSLSAEVGTSSHA